MAIKKTFCPLGHFCGPFLGDYLGIFLYGSTLKTRYNIAICPRRMRLYKRHDVIGDLILQTPCSDLVLGTINFVNRINFISGYFINGFQCVIFK